LFIVLGALNIFEKYLDTIMIHSDILKIKKTELLLIAIRFQT